MSDNRAKIKSVALMTSESSDAGHSALVPLSWRPGFSFAIRGNWSANPEIRYSARNCVVQSVKQNPVSVYMFGNWYGCCCVVFLDFSVEAIEGRVSVMVSAVMEAKDAYRTKGTLRGTTGFLEYLASSNETERTYAQCSQPRRPIETALKMIRHIL
jgi:hypothetical protein